IRPSWAEPRARAPGRGGSPRGARPCRAAGPCACRGRPGVLGRIPAAPSRARGRLPRVLSRYPGVAMPAVLIVRAQWGAEGTGTATDLLCEPADSVVKRTGGNTAGPTVAVDGAKFALKLLPAGILSSQDTPVIGNGVVVHLGALFEEIEMLTSRGVDAS